MYIFYLLVIKLISSYFLRLFSQMTINVVFHAHKHRAYEDCSSEHLIKFLLCLTVSTKDTTIIITILVLYVISSLIIAYSVVYSAACFD